MGNEKEALLQRKRAKMTIKDIFAKPSAELSDQNNSNLQKFAKDMVITQENNKSKVNNLLKKFQKYESMTNKDQLFEGSENQSIRSKKSKLSHRTGNRMNNQ